VQLQPNTWTAANRFLEMGGDFIIGSTYLFFQASTYDRFKIEPLRERMRREFVQIAFDISDLALQYGFRLEERIWTPEDRRYLHFKKVQELEDVRYGVDVNAETRRIEIRRMHALFIASNPDSKAMERRFKQYTVLSKSRRIRNE
jgi:hypothetical protein